MTTIFCSKSFPAIMWLCFCWCRDTFLCFSKFLLPYKGKKEEDGFSHMTRIKRVAEKKKKKVE